MNKAGMNNSAVSLGILKGLVMDSVKVYKSFIDFAKTLCTILKFKLNNDRFICSVFIMFSINGIFRQ